MLGWQLRRIGAVLLGTVLIGSGLLMGTRMSRAIDERVRSGERVAARVERVGTFRVSRAVVASRLTVTWTARGEGHTARLSNEFDEGTFHPGDTVELFVDRASPGKAATADGYATEDLLLQVPAVAEGLGLVVILIALASIRAGRASSRPT